MATSNHTADGGLFEPPADVPGLKIRVKLGLVLSEQAFALSLKPPGRCS